MKDNAKDSDSSSGNQTKVIPKLMVWLIIFISLTSIFYSLKFTHTKTHQNPQITCKPSLSPQIKSTKTELKHIVFGISASKKQWGHTKNYIKQWWRPNQMRGFVWLDRPLDKNSDSESDYRLPQLKISSDSSNFSYTNKQGFKSAIRMTRIVLETVRLKLENARWVVLGDDDTVFFAENLMRVLNKYDHNQFYYIGSSSESHTQNIQFFSYNMAYGGGGFAISYPLAEALEKMIDGCIERYPELYGSDDRIQACLAELGVPLTREVGFHQYDVYGNLFGLLVAHPIAPLVSIHHLDLVQPIFPKMDRVKALQHLNGPMKLDSAGLMQQSICYDGSRKWTVSVSWGYAVQFVPGIVSAREMEKPLRTFINWYKKADYTAYAFNTRAISKNICQRPIVYYLSNVVYDPKTNQTVSEYTQHRAQYGRCNRTVGDLFPIHWIEVYKKPDPYLWDKPPRRNCCRVLPSRKIGTVAIDIGVCTEGEIIA